MALSLQKEQFFCSFLERTSFVLFALPNASEKDKKIVLFDYMKNGSLYTKRAIFLFLSRKERHLYFLPCQMHQKRTKKLFLLTTWRMALSLQKEQFFCSFLEKNVICTFCLAKCIRKGKKKNPFDYMKNGSLSTKRASFLFLSRKERHLYFLPCQMHQKRTKKLFLLTTWRMALSLQKEQFFCSFLEKNVICTFCLAKCIRKGPKNCSFWLHEEWLSLYKKSNFFVPF